MTSMTHRFVVRMSISNGTIHLFVHKLKLKKINEMKTLFVHSQKKKHKMKSQFVTAQSLHLH